MSSMHAKFDLQPVGQERQLAPTGSVFGWHENSAHAHSRQVNIHTSFNNVFNDRWHAVSVTAWSQAREQASEHGGCTGSSSSKGGGGRYRTAAAADFERKTAALHCAVPRGFHLSSVLEEHDA